MLAVIKRLQDGVLQLHRGRRVVSKEKCAANARRTHQLAEVVNRVAEQGRDREIMCPGDKLVARQLAQVDARQVKQRVLVVWPVLSVDLEVVGRDAVEARPNRWLDAIELG